MHRLPLIALTCALFVGVFSSTAQAETQGDKELDHKSVTISEIPKFPPPHSSIPQWRRDRIQIHYFVASTNKPESLEYKLFTSGQSLSNLETNIYAREPLLPLLEAYREEPRRWFERNHSSDLNTLHAGAAGPTEKQSRNRAASELRRLFTAINLYELSQDLQFRKLAEGAYNGLAAVLPNRLDLATMADSELKKRYGWNSSPSGASMKTFELTLHEIESRLPLLNRLVDDLAKESNVPPKAVRAIKLKEQSESLGRWVDILIDLKTPRELVDARFQYHHLEIEYINSTEAAKQATNPNNPTASLSDADRLQLVRAELAEARAASQKENPFLLVCFDYLKMSDTTPRSASVEPNPMDAFITVPDRKEVDRRIQAVKKVLYLMHPVMLLELNSEPDSKRFISEALPFRTEASRKDLLERGGKQNNPNTLLNLAADAFIPQLEQRHAMLNAEIQEAIQGTPIPNEVVEAIKSRVRKTILLGLSQAYVAAKTPKKIRDLESEERNLSRNLATPDKSNSPNPIKN